jgi:hypothetical protein
MDGDPSLDAGEEPERSPGGCRCARPTADRDAHAGGRQDPRRHGPKDNLILPDALDTKICVLLSISTLLGVGQFPLTGPGSLAGFIIATFAIHMTSCR